MPLSSSINSSGIASGIDSNSIISQLVSLQSANKNRLQTKKSRETTIQNSYTTLATKLSALKTAGTALTSDSIFSAKTATSSNTSAITTSTSTGAVTGSYNVDIVQRSKAASLQGAVASLGTVDQSASLVTAGFTTPVTPGAGKLTINGTEITYDASNESLTNVLARINNSDAGVNAYFDKFTQSVRLTDKSGTGTIDIADTAGNLGAALNLTTGTYTAPVQAQIKIEGINNGNAISSTSDSFAEAETGIIGLTLNLQADTGTSIVKVNTDSAPLQKALQDFATAYNDVQDYIAKNKTITGSGASKQTGVFYGDQVVQGISRQLRATVGQAIDDPAASLKSLSTLGFGTTGTTASLSLFDATKLTTALTDDPDSVKNLIAGTDGVLTKINSYIKTQVTGTNGLISNKNRSITDTIEGLTQSISTEDRKLSAYEKQLRASYAAMEKTISSYQSGLSSILSAIGQ